MDLEQKFQRDKSIRGNRAQILCSKANNWRISRMLLRRPEYMESRDLNRTQDSTDNQACRNQILLQLLREVDTTLTTQDERRRNDAC